MKLFLVVIKCVELIRSTYKHSVTLHEVLHTVIAVSVSTPGIVACNVAGIE